MTLVQKIALTLIVFTLLVKLPLFVFLYFKTKKNPFLPEQEGDPVNDGELKNSRSQPLAKKVIVEIEKREDSQLSYLLSLVDIV